MRRLAGLLLVIGCLVLVACSSSDRSTPSSGTTSLPTATTAPAPVVDGATGPDPVGSTPAGSQVPTTLVDPSTTIRVTLEPVVPQGAATARDQGAAASAQAVNDCINAGGAACREVNAPLVAYPGGQLSGIDLAHATLTGADLRGANLSGVDLTGANLSGADLSGADLSATTLAGANLRGATMKATVLVATDLRGADLFDAIVDGSDFTRATFCATTWVDGRELNTSC